MSSPQAALKHRHCLWDCSIQLFGIKMHRAGQIVTITMVVTLCASKSPYVQNFFRSPDEASQPLTLKAFSWDSCGSSSDIFRVKSFSLTPDPVVLPGNVSISFAWDYLDEFGSPLQAAVLFAKKVGPIYVKIPCVYLFGSCSYKDFCWILGMIPHCPDALTKWGIGCQCPFQKGHVSMPATSFELEALPLPAGDYHAQINLTTTAHSTTRHVGCYDIYLTLSEENSMFGQQYLKKSSSL